MSDTTFDFNLFIKESKDVLLTPKSYFSTMKTSGGMTEPLIKAVIYGAVAGAIKFLWSIVGFGALTGGLFGSAIGIMVFIWSIIAAILGLFIGAVILMIISSICKGTTDFEANIRVTAALMVIMPISALFVFSSHFIFYSGILINLIINIYALWLLYNGLVQALKANPETSKIVTYVLIAIFAVFMLAGMGARKRLMHDFNKQYLNEMMREIPKN